MDDDDGVVYVACVWMGRPKKSNKTHTFYTRNFNVRKHGEYILRAEKQKEIFGGLISRNNSGAGPSISKKTKHLGARQIYV